jgi:hypothetical protein
MQKENEHGSANRQDTDFVNAVGLAVESGVVYFGIDRTLDRRRVGICVTDFGNRCVIDSDWRNHWNTNDHCRICVGRARIVLGRLEKVNGTMLHALSHFLLQEKNRAYNTRIQH